MKGRVFGYLESGGRGGLRLSRDIARHEEWTEAILPAEADGTGIEGETNRKPLVGFGIVAVGLLGLLAARLFILQIVDGGHNLALADGNRIRAEVSRAPRGQILDRNGAVLATNQASFDVTVVPQRLPDTASERADVYARVAGYLGLSPNEVKERAEVTCRNLDIEKSGCLNTPVAQLVASNVARDKALTFDQSSGDLGAFSLDTNPIREYKDDGLLSVALGYTGRVSADEEAADPAYGPTDLIGKLGLEKQYEALLKGVNGASQSEVDATGKPVRVLASRQPEAGNDLVLSIDFGLQKTLAAAIQRQMQASGAQRAAGVAINPKTGEILASVSMPSYDNNLFSRGISAGDYAKLTADAGQPLFNKVSSGGYPSGSIIKPLGAAAALQEKIVSAFTTVNDAGRITVPNKYDPSKPATYLGWQRTTGLGQVNVMTALSRSSDIFFYKVMGGLFGTDEDFTKPLGIDKLADYYQKFGLGAKTGVDLPTEAAGRVPTPAWKKAFSGEDWYTGDTYNVSVGQGDILVSPLQMVAALGAVANGGTLYQPHYLTKVTGADGKTVKTVQLEVTRQGFISSANLATIRQGMLMTVNDDNGTACCKIRSEVPVKVAAKTGTAETVVRDDGSDPSLQSKPNAWFEAFAPYDDPQIAIVVLVEHGGEGSAVAAPPARETLAWYFTQGAGKR